ncbi:hypothetical protein BX600DRAFT_130603 [Xylariales sp. PMI_506]|nr:hypothetical protein BX600DRAFT_130603 [Xylariales sp. PMI_506]
MAPPSYEETYRDPGQLPTTLHAAPIDSTTSYQIQTSTPVNRRGTTPYLGLQARLSQVWLNRWTVLLLLILARVLILLSSLNDDLADAQTEALAACTKVEDVGSAMASMPHYLSVGVNKLAASGITDAVHGLMTVLDLILTGVQELILFVINMMTSTYTCLIAAAVHGGLNVSAEVITKTTDAMNEVIQGIGGDISTVVSSFTSTLTSTYNSIANTVDGLISLPTLPTINLSSDLDKLKNVSINTSGFVSDLDNLNDKLPTFSQVQNFTANAVALPFDLVKQALNDSYGNWQFDQSVFPVAQKQALSFCSDNSVLVDFFNELFVIADKAKIAAIAILCILAVLACVPMAWWELRTWRHQRQYRELFQARKKDETDFMAMSAHPFTSKIGIKVADFILGNKSHTAIGSENRRFSEHREMLVRWCIAYGSTIPALFVLSLAIAGFFSCLCQYIILAAIQKEVPALASAVGNFANEVVSTLEQVSEGWANDANGVITGYQGDINNDVLGYVVNATSAVNNTLNTFTDLLSEALTTVFNDTILMDPIQEVVFCLIGLKVQSVEKGLTWVHDNAHVTLPLFPNDTFSAGAADSIDGDSDLTTFLATPSSVTSDDVTAAVTKVTTAIHNNIVQEALISLGLLLVYVLVVLIGVVRSLVGMAMPGRDYLSKRNMQTDLNTTQVVAKIPASFRSSGDAPRRPRASDTEGTFADYHEMKEYPNSSYYGNKQ